MSFRDYSKFDQENSYGTIFKKTQKFPWNSIHHSAKQRCNNPNNSHYKNYGGRGIKFFITLAEIKELWFRDRAYLLKVPSIDRKDNNGNYTFDNCRFMELSDNASHKYDNKEYPLPSYKAKILD